MWVNSNFMNFSRLTSTLNRVKKIDSNINIDCQCYILDYSVENMYNLDYIENDTDYKFQLNSDYVKIIIFEATNIINLLNENDKDFDTIKHSIKTTFKQLYYDILFDNKYQFFLNTESYIKTIKIKVLNEKIEDLIKIEDYEKCSEIKKEIALLLE